MLTLFIFFEFDCNPLVEYNETNKSIVIEYYLPKLNEIPNSIYNGRKNKLYKELSLSAHNKLYDDIIYKIVIRSIAEIYHFDLLKKSIQFSLMEELNQKVRLQERILTTALYQYQ